MFQFQWLSGSPVFANLGDNWVLCVSLMLFAAVALVAAYSTDGGLSAPYAVVGMLAGLYAVGTNVPLAVIAGILFILVVWVVWLGYRCRRQSPV